MATRRWLLAVMAALAVLTSGVTPIFNASATGLPPVNAEHARVKAMHASATAVRRVTPLDNSGHLRSPYTVKATARGYCWTSSFMHGRAYRCFQGNNIMDPCWKEHGRKSVVCLLRPWASNVTRLRLTRKLPDTTNSAGALWGLRLGSGIRVNCLASTGAGGSIGNRHISYYCKHGWVLLDKPNRQTAVWSIATAKRVGDHYKLRGRKSLLTAWVPIVRSP